MSRLFTTASDASLSALVQMAKERLVIVAPGLSEAVGKALEERVRKDGGPPVLAVILDTDPEVCRLGLGDIAGLEAVRAALAARDLPLQTQEGVRIGLVVADHEVLVFSPTPRLIEAGSTSEEKPNAIRISNQGATDLARACGAGSSDEFAIDQEVGLDFADANDIAELKKDLAETPPRRFHLARLERVFNYKLEFVEFSLEHFKLNTRSVPLPPELLGLAEAGLRNRIRNTFRVFETGNPFEFELADPDDDKATLKITEKWLSDEADRLRKEYFIPLGSKSYGNLILKRLKPEFESGVGRLKSLVDAYAEKVRESIAAKIKGTRDELIKALLPRVKAAPPASWLKRSVEGKLGESALHSRLEEEVDHAFAKVEQAFKPTLACVFKGVNYETITADKHFRERIIDHFGEQEAAKLLSEYDASRAQDASSS
jgi:hypothetical protein